VDAEYERIHIDAKGESLEALLGEAVCPLCAGERMNPVSAGVVFEGLRLPQLSALTATEARQWFEARDLAGPAAALCEDILPRLRALEDAGLGYLAPHREMAGLSGGEAQRVRLAASLGAGLSGVTYVLDEPTQGLHPRDTARLAGVLRSLADAGNAVVVVEHDPALVAAADHVLELGPGPGPRGGRLMASGPPASFGPSTYTGRMLAPRAHPEPGSRSLDAGITVRGATLHNLRGLDAHFPAGALVAVTGVSGSGKSSLVRGVLAASLRAGRPVGCESIELHLPIQRVGSLEQGPAATGTSTVATALGLAEAFRKRFAATPRARALKLSPRHFSTASPGGRCEACEGRGILTVAMDLLPDVTVGCEACQGLGFAGPVLECLVEGLTIAGVLGATVEEAGVLFRADRALSAPLGALVEVGLGYLRLGQETRALSGGEGQRLRLATLLAEPGPGRVALLLDEPARGLGAPEVERLVEALRRLASGGHLVVAVEHDLDFIRAADWVLDLGPEGGPQGGFLVVAGTPRDIRNCAESFTGRVLQ